MIVLILLALILLVWMDLEWLALQIVGYEDLPIFLTRFYHMTILILLHVVMKDLLITVSMKTKKIS